MLPRVYFNERLVSQSQLASVVLAKSESRGEADVADDAHGWVGEVIEGFLPLLVTSQRDLLLLDVAVFHLIGLVGRLNAVNHHSYKLDVL